MLTMCLQVSTLAVVSVLQNQSQMFSDRTLRQLRVTKERFFADGDGLYIRVTPKGKRTFVYRSQAGGKSRWRVLGHYPTMSLLEARNRVAAGTKVLVPTGAEAFKEYLPRLRQHYKRPGEVERRFRADILPAVGAKRVDTVTRNDCSDLLLTIVGRGSKVAANRTLTDVKNFFAYCLERGWRNDNPAVGITKRSVGGGEKPVPRNLQEAELSILINELRRGRFRPRTRLVLALLLCTGTRASEVLGVSRNEVAKLSTGWWWHVPGHRTKNGREHKVYLSPQSRALFRLAFRHFGVTPFAGMKHNPLSRAIGRLPIRPPASPHKFRHTMATRLTDMGVAPHITEKMLNHRLGSMFEIYNHSEFLPERRAAWRLWGAYLAKLRRQHALRRAVRPVHAAGVSGEVHAG